MKNIIICILYIFPAIIFSQVDYNVEGISKILKENANAVIRNDETIFTIKSIDLAIKKRHIVITILNDKGEDELAIYRLYYDKFSKIEAVDGFRYDAMGKQTDKLKKSDIQDIGLSAYNYSVTDGRIKIAAFAEKSRAYPYTVEYTSVVSMHNMMFYPVWRPTEHEHISIENASLTIITPEAYSFRHSDINMPGSAQLTRDEKTKTVRWVIENIAAFNEKPYLAVDSKPMVITAPIEFEVEGYHGNIKTWSDVGKFYATLNQGRDKLPESVVSKVKDMTQQEKDPLKKIDILYKYLQANTRYMSIQLGIGGWQAMKAEDVAEKGYGDCKALSNYMVALLKEAGITAYPALINAGNHFFKNSSFPSFSFNHAITCVPIQKDTIWLECTSQTNPMGYQGSFTGNRNALLILPDGGASVNTTTYKPADNLQSRKAIVTIDEKGQAKASVHTTYTGIQQEQPNAIFHELNKDSQKNYLLKHISIPSFDLIDFSWQEYSTRLPKMIETLNLTIYNIANKSGSRLFLIPNLMTDFFAPIISEGVRSTPLFLDPNIYNIVDADTIVYVLPNKYIPETLPASVSIHSKFGDYTCTYTFKDNQLMYCRRVIVEGGIFPAADYAEWIEFVKKIMKSDKTAIVFGERK